MDWNRNGSKLEMFRLEMFFWRVLYIMYVYTQEDYWGMDDEKDWHGKFKPESETQLQRKRRILRRSGTEMLIGFLVNFVALVYYIYWDQYTKYVINLPILRIHQIYICNFC